MSRTTSNAEQFAEARFFPFQLGAGDWCFLREEQGVVMVLTNGTDTESLPNLGRLGAAVDLSIYPEGMIGRRAALQVTFPDAATFLDSLIF